MITLTRLAFSEPESPSCGGLDILLSRCSIRLFLKKGEGCQQIKKRKIGFLRLSSKLSNIFFFGAFSIGAYLLCLIELLILLINICAIMVYDCVKSSV